VHRLNEIVKAARRGEAVRRGCRNSEKTPLQSTSPPPTTVLVSSGFRPTCLVTVTTTSRAALGCCSYRSVALPDVYHMLLMSYNARAQAQHHQTTRL
jgi:hypothetical protein